MATANYVIANPTGAAVTVNGHTVPAHTLDGAVPIDTTAGIADFVAYLTAGCAIMLDSAVASFKEDAGFLFESDWRDEA
jgi:hypothetical protein